MGIDYSFTLVYGFEMDETSVHKHFEHSSVEKREGSFHMEDRFDPKTGAKIAPEKVWDVKPKNKTTRWHEINGVRYDDLNSEEWEFLLKQTFDCHVETFGSFPSGDLTYVFSVNDPIPWQESTDYGKVTIYNDTIPQSELPELKKKANALKDKLEKAGFVVPEPKIFIAQRVS